MDGYQAVDQKFFLLAGWVRLHVDHHSEQEFCCVALEQKMVQFIFVLLLVGVMVVSYAGGVYFVKILRTNTL